MKAYEGSKSAWDNFGKFIYQFQPETKTLIRKLEKILNKLYRQNLPLLYNETCLNLYIYIYIRSAYDKFPAFFVWAFKIVVDSWKFTMLLLYILWDDWPIFMISASNEQLQQQLEYTLLKPDCHSWGISKMQSDILEERYAIKFRFKLGKNNKKVWNASNCFWNILHESSISFWVA